MRSIIDAQKKLYDIHFTRASLQLADGALPQIAIELDDVTFSTRAACGEKNQQVEQPGLRMARLQIPFRFFKLLVGKVEAGEVTAQNVVIDLDRLKDPCPETASSSKSEKARGTPSHLAAAVGAESADESADESDDSHDDTPDDVLATEPASSASGHPAVASARESRPGAEPAASWWTDEQFRSIRSILRGVRFQEVELRFETKKASNASPGKFIRLEDFELSLIDGNARIKSNDRSGPSMRAEGHGAVHLHSFVRIPPELTYGEALPRLAIEGDADARSADVNVTADLSEGALESFAHLTPLPDGRLSVEAKASVSNLPLSTTMPLFTKSGLISKKLKPKFLWLNCGVSIQGEFQGLLENHPLFFERCSIEGNGAEIRLGSAVRHPDGHWSPFQVDVHNLELKRVFDLFETQGPNGIASDFGRITGGFRFTGSRRLQAHFAGTLEGAQIHFSSRNLRAIQTVTRMNAEVDLDGSEMRAKINSVDLLNGSFKGELDLDGDIEFRREHVRLLVEDLSLDPVVQKILINGEISPAKGKGEAKIVEGRLASVDGDWLVDTLNGRDFQLKLARVQTSYDEGLFKISVKAPRLLLNGESPFFSGLRPVFFAHTFASPWIEMREVSARASVSEDHGIEWDHAQGLAIEHQLSLVSNGRISKTDRIDGWVNADYPLAKKLKWSLVGTFDQPKLEEQSKNLRELHRKDPVNDKVLGLRAQEP